MSFRPSINMVLTSWLRWTLLNTYQPVIVLLGFPGGSAVKRTPPNAGDVCSIPGSGRSPGGGNSNPL